MGSNNIIEDEMMQHLNSILTSSFSTELTNAAATIKKVMSLFVFDDGWTLTEKKEDKSLSLHYKNLMTRSVANKKERTYFTAVVTFTDNIFCAYWGVEGEYKTWLGKNNTRDILNVLNDIDSMVN